MVTLSQPEMRGYHFSIRKRYSYPFTDCSITCQITVQAYSI